MHDELFCGFCNRVVARGRNACPSCGAPVFELALNPLDAEFPPPRFDAAVELLDPDAPPQDAMEGHSPLTT